MSSIEESPRGAGGSGSPAGSGSPRIALYLSYLGSGGAQRVFLNLARGFRAEGFAVDVVLARAEGELLGQIPEGVQLIDLGAGGALAAVPRLRRYLHTQRPDVLLSSIHYVNVSALLASRVLGRAPCRVVVREANVLSTDTFRPGKLYDRVLLFLMRWLYPRADAVLANAEDSRDALVQYGVVPRERIRCIANPLDCAGIAAAAAEPTGHPWLPDTAPRDTAPRDADMRAPGQADAPPVVIGVGILLRKKNFAFLIRGFAEATRHPAVSNARLIILGEGDDRPALEALVQELGIAERVSMPGFAANPFAFMARADVFVLSSLWEGSANVVSEALACGTPVIAADCPGGARELLDVAPGQTEGRYGRMVPLNNVAALAHEISRALSAIEPDARARARERARAYDLPVITRQYLDALGFSKRLTD